MKMTSMMGKGHKHYKPIQEFATNNVALDRKLKEACIGLKPCTQHLLMELPTDEDRELIANYIIEWANTYGNGIMMSVNTKISYITSLVYLSSFLHHTKSFKLMTKEDIIDGYLKSIKVVLMTAYEIKDNEFYELFLSPHVDGFVQKPIFIRNLTNKILDIIDESKRRLAE